MNNKRVAERIDAPGCFVHVHNSESNKLPGHKQRMKTLCERVEKEQRIKNKKRKKK